MNDRLQQVLQTQQDQKNTPTLKKDEGILQLVGFMVGDEEFSVPILSIQEIVKPIEYTRIPSTPTYVLGVFNLRGNVIPLISLRMKFGLPEAKNTDDTRMIVIKDKNQVIGYVIDKLTEALRIRESDIDPAPETAVQDEKLIYGVGKRDDRIITILNIEGLMHRDF